MQKSVETGGENRWLIGIGGFARINYPNLWNMDETPSATPVSDRVDALSRPF